MCSKTVLKNMYSAVFCSFFLFSYTAARANTLLHFLKKLSLLAVIFLIPPSTSFCVDCTSAFSLPCLPFCPQLFIVPWIDSPLTIGRVELIIHGPFKLSMTRSLSRRSHCGTVYDLSFCRCSLNEPHPTRVENISIWKFSKHMSYAWNLQPRGG